jgi:hypothetical protein
MPYEALETNVPSINSSKTARWPNGNRIGRLRAVAGLSTRRRGRLIGAPHAAFEAASTSFHSHVSACAANCHLAWVHVVDLRMAFIFGSESKSIRSLYMDFVSVCAVASAWAIGGTVTERVLTVIDCPIRSMVSATPSSSFRNVGAVIPSLCFKSPF